MNEYEFEHRQPTIEHFLSEYKNNEAIIGVPKLGNFQAISDFTSWANGFFSLFECHIGRLSIDDDLTKDNNCDIIYIDEDLPPFETLQLLTEGFNALKIGGILICNNYFSNKPQDDFEKNTRYGIDAFCFTVQYRIDILYKGNQIILKKLG